MLSIMIRMIRGEGLWAERRRVRFVIGDFQPRLSQAIYEVLDIQFETTFESG